MKRRWIPVALAAALMLSPAMAQTTGESKATLTLREAVDRALTRNPDLRALSWETPVASARREQAALRPNPELGVEIENIGLGGNEVHTRTRALGLSPTLSPTAEIGRDTSDSGGGFDELEMTLRLSQVIELGGKRAARVAASERGIEVASWDYEVARHELVRETVARFAATLSAQERLRQAEGLAELAAQLSAVVAQQVEAGRVSPLERRRAGAEAERLRIAVEAREAAHYRARLALAALWGAVGRQQNRL